MKRHVLKVIVFAFFTSGILCGLTETPKCVVWNRSSISAVNASTVFFVKGSKIYKWSESGGGPKEIIGTWPANDPFESKSWVSMSAVDANTVFAIKNVGKSRRIYRWSNGVYKAITGNASWHYISAVDANTVFAVKTTVERTYQTKIYKLTDF